MPQTSITLSIGSELKVQCDALFSKFGISTVAAIDIFLHQAVMKQEIPFNEDDLLSCIVSSLPEAGRIDPETGCYILPNDWNNPEDDVYDQSIWRSS